MEGITLYQSLDKYIAIITEQPQWLSFQILWTCGLMQSGISMLLQTPDAMHILQCGWELTPTFIG